MPVRFLIALVLSGWPLSLGWAEETPSGPFTQVQCLSCHEERNLEIVAGWRKSVHATVQPQADCLTCHGDRHGGAAARARRSQTCTSACHGGPNGEATQSWRLSKHGVIASLEERNWDWSRPLADGNYRTPTCAYCHLHAGDHAMGGATVIADPLADPGAARLEETIERRSEACRDCHSPRFTATWFASGERMIAIGRMKAREGKAVLEWIDALDDPDASRQAATLWNDMVKHHLRNVRLGVFHQSPDHQWWHGQPALDGDLLRLKGILGNIQRR